MIVAGCHQVGDIGVSGRRDFYPFVPTVMHTENEFGASSLESHPDSARTKMMLWLPSWAEAAFMPRLGDTVIGEASINDESFVYFAGVTDAIKAGRRKGEYSPAVTRFAAPTVSVRDWDADAGTFVTRPAESVSRANGVTTIAIAPREVEPAEVTVQWSIGAAARPKHVLVLGGPTNIAPLDRSATAPNQVVPVSVSKPLVSVTGTDRSVRDNQTAYQVRPNVAVTVTYVFTVNPRVNDRVLRLADPVIVDMTGGKKVKGRFVQIDASDFLAPAGRMRIGDTPFPMEFPGARWNKVRTLLRANDLPMKASSLYNESGALSAGSSTMNWFGGATGVSAYVKPLDIDSRSALEVLQRTAMAAGGATVTSTKYGLDYQLRATPFSTLSEDGLGNYGISMGNVTIIPAHLVEEVPRTLSSESIVNQVEWDIAQPDGEGGVAETVGLVAAKESISKSGPSPLKLVSDAYREGTNQIVTLQYRAMNLLRTEPVWTFDEPVEITDISEVPHRAHWLLDPTTRHGHAVWIPGTRPDDVGATWRVRAGSFTVGEDAPVMLQLDPADWLPDLGMSYQDIWVMRASPRITFANMGTVTFDDMMEVEY